MKPLPIYCTTTATTATTTNAYTPHNTKHSVGMHLGPTRAYRIAKTIAYATVTTKDNSNDNNSYTVSREYGGHGGLVYNYRHICKQ